MSYDISTGAFAYGLLHHKSVHDVIMTHGWDNPVNNNSYVDEDFNRWTNR